MLLKSDNFQFKVIRATQDASRPGNMSQESITVKQHATADQYKEDGDTKECQKSNGSVRKVNLVEIHDD